MGILTSLLAGLVFGLGLIVSGIVRRHFIARIFQRYGNRRANAACSTCY